MPQHLPAGFFQLPAHAHQLLLEGWRVRSASLRLRFTRSHQPLHRLLAERTEILECLRTTGEDCYTLKIAATSMPHLEKVVDELMAFGSTTTNIVYSQSMAHRGVNAPPPETP